MVKSHLIWAIFFAANALELLPCGQSDCRLVVHVSADSTALEILSLLESLLLVDYSGQCVRVVVRAEGRHTLQDSVLVDAFSDFIERNDLPPWWIVELERARGPLWGPNMCDGTRNELCMILDLESGPLNPKTYAWIGKAREAYGLRGDVVAFSVGSKLELSRGAAELVVPPEEAFFTRFVCGRPALFVPISVRWKELMTAVASFGSTFDPTLELEALENWSRQLNYFVERRDLYVVHAPEYFYRSKFPSQPDKFNWNGELLKSDYTYDCKDSSTCGRNLLLAKWPRNLKQGESGRFEASDYRFATVQEVCVVLTAYNNANTVLTSLQSVLTQSHSHLTVVAVDDASSDGTACLLHNASATDRRLRPLLRKARSPGGVGHPANMGMDNCPDSAEYIAFLDADDLMEPEALRQLVTLASSLRLDAAIGDFVRVASSHSRIAPAYDRHVTKILPRNLLIDPIAMPELFRLSPVPWRKLYNLNFLRVEKLRFPEGDYYFEDNTLHWDVLLHANRVAYIDEPIIRHLIGSERQTTAYLSDTSRATALSGFFANLRIIQSKILRQNQSINILISDPVPEFATFMSRSKWVARMQPTTSLRMKFGRILTRLADDFIIKAKIKGLSSFLESNRLVNFKTRILPKPQLSVVLPCRDVDTLIDPLLVKLLTLPKRGVDVEIFVIDDRSEDSTLELATKIARSTRTGSVHVLYASASGAGKARNRALPLLEGEFALFVDADDDVNIDALIDALRYAQTQPNIDLVFLSYRIKTPNTLSDMWHSDRLAFKDVAQNRLSSDADAYQRRAFFKALGLTNYPWNRLTRTTLLHDRDIYFGSTTVHNDVRFHWTTIAAAEGHIAFYDVNMPVVTHTKDLRRTLTSVADARRMEVFDALHETRCALNPIFFAKENATIAWRAFTIRLVKWAAPKIPPSLHNKARKQCFRVLLLAPITPGGKEQARQTCESNFLSGPRQEPNLTSNETISDKTHQISKQNNCPAQQPPMFLSENSYAIPITRHQKRHARRAKRAQTRKKKKTVQG